jgi:dCMP deaminase
MANWDARFMALAALVASWSKDKSTQVGAVIVDKDKRVVSLGYNGPPKGTDDGAVLADRDEKIRRTVHAEANAILFARRDLAGLTLYSTHYPCAKCMALIIQAGIAEVVCPEPDGGFKERWAGDFESAGRMAHEANVWLRAPQA